MFRAGRQRRLLPLYVSTVLLLLFSYLTPLAVGAQGDLASPEVPEPTIESTATPEPTVEPSPTQEPTAEPTATDEPTVTPTEEPDFGAATFESAVFDTASYSAAPGTTISGSLTISMTGITPQSNYALLFTLPIGVSLAPGTATGSAGITECSVQTGAGNLNGTIASVAIGTCVISFTIILLPTATPGNTGTLTAQVPIGVPQNSASFTVAAPPVPPTAAWEMANYSVAQGGSVQLVLTIDYLGAFPNGLLTISSLLPFAFDFTVESAVASDPAVTCSATTPLPGTPVSGTVGATGQGTCTITLDVATTPSAVPGFPIQLLANVPGTLGPAVTIVTVAAPTPPTATFDQISYNVQAGATFPAILTIEYLGAYNLPGTASITTIFPGAMTFTIVSATPSSPSVTCVTNTAGPAVTASVDVGATAGGTCTITIDVTASPTMPTGIPVPISATITGIPAPVTTNVFGSQVPSTAVFDAASYGALPGESVDATLTIHLGVIALATFTITPPGPGTDVTFSNVLATAPPSTVCFASLSVGTGNIDGTVAALTGGGVCTISFTMSVSAGATPGNLASPLIASVLGITPAPIAQFTILAPVPPLAIAPITFNVVAGDLFSGDLTPFVSGGVPPYSFSEVTPPTQGTLNLNADGTFTYTANPGATGSDSFVFLVTDSQIVPVSAAATTQGTVNIIIAAPSPTPTLEPGVTPSPTATLEPGVTPSPTATVDPDVTPSPTNDTGVVGPGDPETPDATAEDARATETTDDNGNGGDGDGNGITTLPSTGSGSDTSSMGLFALLLAGTILLAGAAIAGRRRINQ